MHGQSRWLIAVHLHTHPRRDFRPYPVLINIIDILNWHVEAITAVYYYSFLNQNCGCQLVVQAATFASAPLLGGVELEPAAAVLGLSVEELAGDDVRGVPVVRARSLSISRSSLAQASIVGRFVGSWSQHLRISGLMTARQGGSAIGGRTPCDTRGPNWTVLTPLKATSPCVSSQRSRPYE